MKRTLSIGIAGCGIGGLAAGAMLARAGHRVTVFDRFEAPAAVGSGLVLQPVGLMVLEAMGLRGAAEARGARIEALRGRCVTGRRVLDARYDGAGAGRAALAMHRAALFGVLLGAARGSGAVLEPGATVTGAGADSFRLVRPEGTSEAAGPFDLMIDATGAGSALTPDPGRALPFGALWATVDWPADEDQPPLLDQVYQGARRMAGILPLGRPEPAGPLRTAVFWSLPVAEYGLWRSAPLADWKDEAAALWPRFGGFLDGIADHDGLAMARYRHRTLASPVRGRLVHLGDSWHAASPQLGQGANMALLDALALARALEEEPELDRALRRYRASRTAHVRLYQAISRVFTPLYQSESRALAVLRDRLLAPASRLPGMGRLLGLMVSGDLIPPLR